ncbi:MAG TPA: PocR ligand-binding domain-containing protein [Nitrospiraceae bacterium]|nr:PocR ligand-binding domain-containing protein [Nitrospiraceae bacterium]
MPSNSVVQSIPANLPPSFREELLDRHAWQPMLEKYAQAVNLAVASVDKDGHCGTIVNARPTWSMVSAKASSSVGDCGFSLSSSGLCTCVVDAMNTGDMVFVRDRVRLVHFAIPLRLGEHRLGALIGGQVFDQYPDQLALGHIANTVQLPPDEVWQTARLEHPVKRTTLRVYAELLQMIGDMFLQRRYQMLMDEHRLAEMTRLREDLQERVQELEAFERAVVGRELKMIELESEMQALKREAYKPPSES